VIFGRLWFLLVLCTSCHASSAHARCCKRLGCLLARQLCRGALLVRLLPVRVGKRHRLSSSLP
jgi:hypothetical protein